MDKPTENLGLPTIKRPEGDPPAQDTPQIQGTIAAPVLSQPTASKDVLQTSVLLGQTLPSAHSQVAKEDIEMKDMGAPVSYLMPESHEGPSTSTVGPSRAAVQPSTYVSMYEEAGVYPASTAGTSSSGKGAAKVPVRMRNVPKRGEDESGPQARQLPRRPGFSDAQISLMYVAYLGLCLLIFWVFYNLLKRGTFGDGDDVTNPCYKGPYSDECFDFLKSKNLFAIKKRDEPE